MKNTNNLKHLHISDTYNYHCIQNIILFANKNLEPSDTNIDSIDTWLIKEIDINKELIIRYSSNQSTWIGLMGIYKLYFQLNNNAIEDWSWLRKSNIKSDKNTNVNKNLMYFISNMNLDNI